MIMARCLGTALVAISATAAAGCSSTSRPSPHWPPARPVTHAIDLGGERFLPEPELTTGKRTAAQVWQIYARGRSLPAGTAAQFGDLTTTATGTVAVWAFRTNGACWEGFGPSPLPTPPRGYCTTWTFLTASGDLVEQTQGP
jgi:hypothetical protein